MSTARMWLLRMLARPFIKVPLNVVVVVPSLSYQTIERVETSLEAAGHRLATHSAWLD